MWLTLRPVRAATLVLVAALGMVATVLSAVAGDASATLSWAAPSFDGGSPVTGYRVYRGTTAGGETFLESVGTGTSFVDSGVANCVNADQPVASPVSCGAYETALVWMPLKPACASARPRPSTLLCATTRKITSGGWPPFDVMSACTYGE